jgi:hypothetical protein
MEAVMKGTSRIMCLAVAASTGVAGADVIIGNMQAGVGVGTIFGTTSSTIYKAAGFTMGSEDYTLDNVRLSLNFAGLGTGVFSIWTGTSTPQVQVVTLDGPPQVGAGDFVFTPSQPLVLEANQTYWVYVQSIPNPVGNFLWDGTSPSTQPTGIATSAGYIFNGNPSAFLNRFEVNGTLAGGCYPNCDGSTVEPILNVADFSCFLGKFAAGDPYANCDGSTIEPVLNVADFSCFLGKFAAGCR